MENGNLSKDLFIWLLKASCIRRCIKLKSSLSKTAWMWSRMMLFQIFGIKGWLIYVKKDYNFFQGSLSFYLTKVINWILVISFCLARNIEYRFVKHQSLKIIYQIWCIIMCVDQWKWILLVVANILWCLLMMLPQWCSCTSIKSRRDVSGLQNISYDGGESDQ